MPDYDLARDLEQERLLNARLGHGYAGAVMDACACSLRDAHLIVEVMRVEQPTLDALERREFRSLARRSQVALMWFRKNDPVTAAFYESLLR